MIKNIIKGWSDDRLKQQIETVESFPAENIRQNELQMMKDELANRKGFSRTNLGETLENEQFQIIVDYQPSKEIEGKGIRVGGYIVKVKNKSKDEDFKKTPVMTIVQAIRLGNEVLSGETIIEF